MILKFLLSALLFSWWQIWGKTSQVVQIVKNLPAMQEIQGWSLGQEDPLQEGMATHSSILAWRIPWTEEPGGLQSMGSQSGTTRRLSLTHSLYCGIITYFLSWLYSMNLSIALMHRICKSQYSLISIQCCWTSFFFSSFFLKSVYQIFASFLGYLSFISLQYLSYTIVALNLRFP